MFGARPRSLSGNVPCEIDTNRKGTLNENQTLRFHKLLGRPLDRATRKAAFHRLLVSRPNHLTVLQKFDGLSDAALKDTPVLSLSNLRPESQMVSGGILSGYSFFAAPIRVEEVLRGVDELLFGKD